ncbi:type II secretion system protein [bacterium]|nr:type II secretion system protein [bacterium]
MKNKNVFTLAEGSSRTEHNNFCHSEHLLCHPELVSGSKKQILNQVQNDKILGSLCKAQHDIITRNELIHFKKIAFTLAEVLITLGVIGVVAAMTIPTLIANINGQRFRSQFKKTLSTLNQAGRMAQAQYGFSYGDIKPKFENCAIQHPETDQTFCALLNGTLTGLTLKYMSDTPYTSAYVQSRIYTGLDQPIWLFSDGSLFTGYISLFCTTPTLSGQPATPENLKKLMESESGTDGCFGWIDVNGVSKPNKEVSCSDGKDTKYLYEEGVEPCVVKNDANHMTDIFPVMFYDTNVIPASNAAQYVLNTAK